MIEGIAASIAAPQLQGAGRPAGQAQLNTEQTSSSAQATRSGSGSAVTEVGASDAAPDQAVNQSPSVSSPGPENDFGRRGTLVDIAA